MKKIFWCSVAVAVAAASSVYLASRHVEECSFKTVGHAIAALGGEDTSAGNDGGIEAITEPKPAPVGDLPTVQPEEFRTTDLTPPPVVAVADGAGQGYATFDDVDPGTDFASSVPMIVSKVGETIQSFPVTPAKMPYCEEETGLSRVRMPYAEEEDTGEEEAEVWGLLRQAAQEATEEAVPSPEKLPVMPKEVNEQEKLPVMPAEVNEQEKVGEEQQSGANEMDQNRHYHDHDMVCPYSGHSCPLPQVCPPAPEAPPVEKKEPMDPSEEQEPPHMKLDTMEFRPSDAGFQRFTPKPF